MIQLTVGNNLVRRSLLGEILDPITKKLYATTGSQLSGQEFVYTMSDAAVDMLSNQMIYWAQEKTFEIYDSAKWGEKKPLSDPKNAIECSPERGKCQCPMGSTIYFGVKRFDGQLDTSQ